MRLAIVYTGFTSYMADCWRALTRLANEGRGWHHVELKIWIEDFQQGAVAFDPAPLMRGLDFWWARSEDLKGRHNEIRDRVVGDIAAWKPDVVFVCGWSKVLPPLVAAAKELRHVPMVIELDMPWEWRVRKIVARFVLRKRLKRFSAVFVPGESTAFYAHWLGFGDGQVFKGKFGIDVVGIGDEVRKRDTRLARRGFLYVGRLSPEKGIRELASAYRKYRELHVQRLGQAVQPWTLDVYGMGPERKWLEGIEGVTIHGFAQPDEIRAAYACAGAFVIASKWDPWPLVILEACAAGLPVICTTNCWNHSELVKENGLVVRPGRLEEMSRAMLSVEQGGIDGSNGRVLAAEYSCEKWAERILKVCDCVCLSPRLDSNCK